MVVLVRTLACVVKKHYMVCSTVCGCSCGVQAVATGAAVQAGIYEGQVSNLMVMDVWQAALMRAFARQQLKEEQAASGRAAAEEEEDEEEEDGWEELPEAAQGQQPRAGLSG